MGFIVYTVPMYKKTILNSIKIELGSAKMGLSVTDPSLLLTYFQQFRTDLGVTYLCDYTVE